MMSSEERSACERLRKLANEASIATARWQLTGRHLTWKQEVTTNLRRLGKSSEPHLAKIESVTSSPNTGTEPIPAHVLDAWFVSGILKSAEILRVAIDEFESNEPVLDSAMGELTALQEAERLLSKLSREEKILLAQRLADDLGDGNSLDITGESGIV